MKNLKILFYLATFAIVAGLFSACNDSNFEPGPGVDGAQVYFPDNIATDYSISDDVSSIAIPVKRIATGAAMSVAIMAEDESGLFTVPSTVNFAAGQASADLVVTFDRAQLVDGMPYPISFLINDEGSKTPYGYDRITVTIMPWPWEQLGKGMYRESYLNTAFGVASFEMEVTIYEHKSNKGIYMIEEMFGWPYLTELFQATQAELSGQFSYTPTNITIDCSDPQQVVIPEQWTGITEGVHGYGNFLIATLSPGSLVDGIITFPEKGLMGEFETSGDQFYANQDGLFRIVLPGYEVADYSLTAMYDGMKVTPDGETASAVIDFAYGDDVTGISYVFASGDVTAEADEYAAKIADGTAENIEQVPDFIMGGELVTIQAEVGDAGTYTIIAVPHDNTNQPRVKEVSAASFYFPGMGGAIPDVDATVELMKVSEYNPSAIDRFPDHSSLVGVVRGTDLIAVKYYFNKEGLIDALESGDPSLPPVKDIMDQYGTSLDAEQLQMIVDNGYWGGIFSKLAPETSFRMIFEAKNSYGKTAIIYTEAASTSAVPYTGEMVVGNYTMTYVANPTTTFTNVFNVIPTVGSDTKFQIKDFACDNEGTLWNAVYDPAASTLTLDGTYAGAQDPTKNYFGGVLGYWNDAQTQVYGYVSFANPETGTGSDPCVIEVDASTKQLSVLKNKIQVPVMDGQGTILGYGGLYDYNTPITKVPASSSVTSLLPRMQSINVPFSSIRIPANKKNLRNNHLGTMAAKSVPMAGFASGSGLRTLSVKSSKCETRPKQQGLRSLVSFEAVK